MSKYGIDNSAQERYLEAQGFTLYPDRYTIGQNTINSMSAMLNLKRGHHRKPVAGNNFVTDILRKNGYTTAGIMAKSYVFENTEVTYDYSLPKAQSRISGLPSFYAAMALGSFGTLQHYKRMPHDEFVEKKHAYIAKKMDQPKFLYTHTGPSHSQNSGRCHANETERYHQRLKRANNEMKQDILAIEQNDPNAIIIINGDHGPYLTKDCYLISRKFYRKKEISRLDMQDRFSAFLAIRLPNQAIIPQEDITILQDVFVQVFDELTKTSAFDHKKMLTRTNKKYPSVALGVYVEDGVIHGGKDDGKLLFERATNEY